MDAELPKDVADDDIVQKQESFDRDSTPVPNEVDIAAAQSGDEVVRHIDEGKVVLKSEVEEGENTLEDGTRLRHKVITTQHLKPLCETVLKGNMVVGSRAWDEVVGYDIEEEIVELAPDVTVEFGANLESETTVEESEETLPDGTWEKKKITKVKVTRKKHPGALQSWATKPGGAKAFGNFEKSELPVAKFLGHVEDQSREDTETQQNLDISPKQTVISLEDKEHYPKLDIEQIKPTAGIHAEIQGMESVPGKEEKIHQKFGQALPDLQKAFVKEGFDLTKETESQLPDSHGAFVTKPLEIHEEPEEISKGVAVESTEINTEAVLGHPEIDIGKEALACHLEIHEGTSPRYPIISDEVHKEVLLEYPEVHSELISKCPEIEDKKMLQHPEAHRDQSEIHKKAVGDQFSEISKEKFLEHPEIHQHPEISEETAPELRKVHEEHRDVHKEPRQLDLSVAVESEREVLESDKMAIPEHPATMEPVYEAKGTLEPTKETSKVQTDSVTENLDIAESELTAVTEPHKTVEKELAKTAPEYLREEPDREVAEVQLPSSIPATSKLFEKESVTTISEQPSTLLSKEHQRLPMEYIDTSDIILDRPALDTSAPPEVQVANAEPVMVEWAELQLEALDDRAVSPVLEKIIIPTESSRRIRAAYDTEVDQPVEAEEHIIETPAFLAYLNYKPNFNPSEVEENLIVEETLMKRGIYCPYFEVDIFQTHAD